MPLRQAPPRETVSADRGDVVVCIPVFGAEDLFAQCLRSVLAHTEADVPLLIADDASPTDGPRRLLDELEAGGAFADREVVFTRQPANAGFVANVNDAFAAAAPADVVVLNSDCVVAAGWLEGLRAAAHVDTNVATASTLTNNGSILSVPDRNRPVPRLPQNRTLDELAASVWTASQRLRPRIPTAVGHCFYVRRSALELVGDFDLTFSPGYGEEVDFSQRCIARGLSHVVADDVLVLHRGGGSFGEHRPGQELHERIIESRYPYYHPWVRQVEAAQDTPLARALAIARRAMTGLAVTIDARAVGPIMTGTQIQIIQLIRALARTGRVRVRVALASNASDHARSLLDDLAGVALIDAHEIVGHPPTEIAHRPMQVTSEDDLHFLRAIGERVVITHQDLIAYRNPAYFPDYDAFADYREVTHQALGLADRVVFFSRHAAEDALAEEIVSADRARVVYIGTEHDVAGPAPQPTAPRTPPGALDLPFLLYLGTDFHHKNRIFSLRLLAALRAETGWNGTLVLAGPQVDQGSSAGAEARLLATEPDLAGSVVELPAVDEPTKAWLMQHARAVVYPTVYEGFGLVPFEATAAGVPCLFAPVTSLAEVLPAEAAVLVPWDASASAAGARPLLDDGDARDRHLALLREAGARFGWAATAEGLLAVYDEVVEQPTRTTIPLAERLTSQADELHAALRHELDKLESIGEDGIRLVGPSPLLPPDVQRALLAVSMRRPLRAPLFAALRALYGAGSAARGGAEPHA